MKTNNIIEIDVGDKFLVCRRDKPRIGSSTDAGGEITMKTPVVNRGIPLKRWILRVEHKNNKSGALKLGSAAERG